MKQNIEILLAFFAKRWTLQHLCTASEVQRRQQRLLGRLMVHARQNFPFYQDANAADFNAWPIIDKTILMREFEGMNAPGLSYETAWAAAKASLQSSNSSATHGDLTIGTSTGTSGQRGLFIVSSTERTLWLGSILAKCLPEFPWTRHRVAVMLATGNDLYQTANASGRLAFSFYDLKQGLASHTEALQAFAPNVLIAPPKAVRSLAELKLGLKLKHVFTGGEILDELDAEAITQWFGVRPRSIYQATEGFLGVACEYGHIHLNEDDMLIEEEPVAGHARHFVPVITDLRRRAQAMIRYRLNDILVKSATSCKCGSPFMALTRVEGRCDDVLFFKASAGGEAIQVMPDSMRAVILDADQNVTDFRLVQTAPEVMQLQLPPVTTAASAAKISSNLSDYLRKTGISTNISIEIVFGIEETQSKKLRRVQREFTQTLAG
jgi:putative adenylate-forming enzyme